MGKPICRVYHSDNQVLISDRIEVASSFFSRLRGLLGRKGLGEGEGLILSPCSSIHCIGMRFAIDAIFLNAHYQVVAIHHNLKPGSTASCRDACYVLELNAGQAQIYNLHTGDKLSINYN